jgi:hypothetical protein
MKNSAAYIPVLIVLLALAVFARVFTYRHGFDELVDRAHRTNVGYDQKLIGVVNRLEEVLAERASFGYTGGKDPMTGTTRRVVKPVRRQPRRVVKKPEADKDTVAAPPPPKPDPVRLTAIIYDDERRKHTAIIMDGERSQSVEQGDRVRDRRVTLITDKALHMESPTVKYYYDIFGDRKRRPIRGLPLPAYLDLPGE